MSTASKQTTCPKRCLILLYNFSFQVHEISIREPYKVADAIASTYNLSTPLLRMKCGATVPKYETN